MDSTYLIPLLEKGGLVEIDSKDWVVAQEIFKAWISEQFWFDDWMKGLGEYKNNSGLLLKK